MGEATPSILISEQPPNVSDRCRVCWTEYITHLRSLADSECSERACLIDDLLFVHAQQRTQHGPVRSPLDRTHVP